MKPASGSIGNWLVALRVWGEQHCFAFALAIMLGGTVSLMPMLNAPIHGDVALYQGVAQAVFHGKIPYRDFAVEYPPYAVLIFLAPGFLGERNYAEGFMMLAILADWLLKYLLFLEGARRWNDLRSLLPLVCYSVAIPYLRAFFLQRYDVWPALISVLAVWLFCSGRFTWSGVAVAAGIGVKLYPIVFVPALFVMALRRQKGRQFASGLAVGLLPIVLLSFIAPWWSFAGFHATRGLQVESLYASALWLGKTLGFAQLDWAWTHSWQELKGPLVSALLPWTRGVFVVAVALSTLVSLRAALCLENLSASRVARVLLIPLLGFVAFNQVFSPQFMIWLLPLAALASMEGSSRTVWVVPLAAMLTPVFYPSPEYGSGLGIARTVALLVRNLMLVGVWIWLIREVFCQVPAAPEQAGSSPAPAQSVPTTTAGAILK